MKIILDFDDTIFSDSLFMLEFLGVFKKFNFTEEEFWNAYQKCKEKAKDFNIKIIISLLDKVRSFDKIKAEKETNLTLDRASNFIYPDFFDFVKRDLEKNSF